MKWFASVRVFVSFLVSFVTQNKEKTKIPLCMRDTKYTLQEAKKIGAWRVFVMCELMCLQKFNVALVVNKSFSPFRFSFAFAISSCSTTLSLLLLQIFFQSEKPCLCTFFAPWHKFGSIHVLSIRLCSFVRFLFCEFYIRFSFLSRQANAYFLFCSCCCCCSFADPSHWIFIMCFLLVGRAATRHSNDTATEKYPIAVVATRTRHRKWRQRKKKQLKKKST